jgi:hypothetical protein
LYYERLIPSYYTVIGTYSDFAHLMASPHCLSRQLFD